ncbi:LOW QUALITY PROTEIN: putative G-protein coupled receptor 152 [Porphyrio hochstetteri]
MELWNATLPPTLLPPPPSTLPWDGRLLAVCVALGLPANAITLWLTGWRLRCRGPATFIFSLAASDFLFLANSVLQVWSVAHEHLWVLGTPLCRLHQFLYGLGYYGGLFLLATISLDRCLLVATPLWYRCRRPERLPAAACVGAWLLAAGCSVPDAALSSSEELLPGVTVCRSERGSWEAPMRWLEVVAEGLVPFAVVVACHGVALALTWCRRGQGHQQAGRFRHVAVATLSAYVVLHLPFQVAQLLQLVAPGRVGHLLYLLGLAFNLSSCLNPCLYLLLSSRACRRRNWPTPRHRCATHQHPPLCHSAPLSATCCHPPGATQCHSPSAICHQPLYAIC